MVPREIKAIEVPCEVASDPSKSWPNGLGGRVMYEQDANKITNETEENLKMMSRVQDETCENVKEVKDKVVSLEAYLKAAETDRISALRHEASVAQQAEQRAHVAEHEVREKLKVQEQARIEVEFQLQRAEEQLRVEQDAHAETRRVAEEVSSAADQAGRDEDGKIAQLQEELARAAAQQDGTIARLQAELKQANDDCNWHKSRQAHSQEREVAEQRLDETLSKLQQVEADYRTLQEQHLQLERESKTREVQFQQREKELADQSAQEEFARRREAFEQQRQESEQQLERQRQELERQAKEHRERNRKGCDADRENKVLRQTVQEQKLALHELQSQLHREQAMATLLTPGEYIKMVKKSEGEGYAHENAELKLRNSTLEIEIKEVKWHIEVLRKHLPNGTYEAVAKELNAQLLPLHEPNSQSAS